MKIKIKVHGHQYFMEYIGEVLKWTETVEKFEELGKITKYLQVPAVIIKEDDTGKILTIPISTQYRWTEINEIK